MSFLHTLANPLSQTQKQNVAKKFRDILDDMTSPLLAAIQYAHTYGIPSVKREEIWKNLFIPPNKELLDPKRNSPSKPPANIYQDWDIQVVLKYLYYGGQRITSFSPVKLYAQDQECYFDYFNITHRYLSLKPPFDDPVGLFAGDYSRALFQAISLRNNTYHNTQNNVDEFTVAGCAAFVEHLSVLLRPLCGAVSWDQTGMERAQKLIKQMWPDVCNAMGDVSYPIADILAYLRIPSTEQTIMEQMLIDAGFTVDQGDVYICGDVDELAYGLLYAWKVGQQIGKEYGVNLLHGCRERMLVFLTPDREEKVYEQKDWQSMPLEVLEKLAQEEDAQAQYQLYCRLCDSEKQSAQILAWGYLQRSARLGYAPAQVQMGIHLEDGTCGQKRSWKEAFSWYEKAAEQNDPTGLYRLGYCYEAGQGVQKDFRQAASWYAQARVRGSDNARVGFARLQLHGEGVKKDRISAIKELNELAQKGFAPALAQLGECYLFGHGVVRNAAAALSYISRAAQLGFAGGQYLLGVCYEKGYGTDRNPLQSGLWYDKAAEQGFAHAQVKRVSADTEGRQQLKVLAEQGFLPAQEKIGLCYYYGREGFQKRTAEAAKYLEAAVQQGSNTAEVTLSLARCYMEGCGVRKDRNLAFELAKSMADEGNADAMKLLSDWYRDGELDDNFGEWEHWLQRAALAGNVIAAKEYAMNYLDGGEDINTGLGYLTLAARNGGAKEAEELAEIYDGRWGEEFEQAGDPAKARYWYQVAAEKGSATACVSLAHCYLKGIGGNRNIRQGVDWLIRAVQANESKYIADLGCASFLEDYPYEDTQAGRRWFFKEAKSGNIRAMLWLGHFHLNGNWPGANAEKGIELLERAFYEHNSGTAAYILSETYHGNDKIAEDPSQSFAWLERAVKYWDDVGKRDANLMRSQYNCGGIVTLGNERWVGLTSGGCFVLGQYYAKGYGTPINQEMAFSCYEKTWKDCGALSALNELIRRYEMGIGVTKDLQKAEQLKREKIRSYV